jgi:hypothetical protein
MITRVDSFEDRGDDRATVGIRRARSDDFAQADFPPTPARYVIVRARIPRPDQSGFGNPLREAFPKLQPEEIQAPAPPLTRRIKWFPVAR